MQTTDMVSAISEAQVAKKIKAGDYNIDTNEIYNDAVQIAQKGYENIEEDENKNLDYMMIEFYTLIAMTALYGATIGLYAINRALPNMGTKGMRMAVSPTPKSKLIISSACASFIVQVIGIAILFLYTALVLDVDYGDSIFFATALALAGCFAGLALGIAIASLLKTNENTKIGIVIGFTMLCSFFAGMMGVEMKYMVDTNIPLLNKINPANMITDGYYALYYYDSPDRFTGDVIGLLIFAFVMIAISICSLRRQKYDSI